MQSLLSLRWSRSARPFSRLALVVLLVLSGSAANATTVVGEVRFDGLNGFGTTEQTAIDSGMPIVSDMTIDLAENLGIGQNFNDASVILGPPATATSDWTVTNNRGEDLASLYLIFAKPLPNTIQIDLSNEIVDYDPVDVGLRLQTGAAPGGGFDWVIFEVPAGGEMYYYPAVSLGSLGDGQTTAFPFQVNYILDDPQTFLGAEGFELGIPQWQILAVFVPVPEPSTALLVASGVVVLAAGRRRRS